MWQALITGTDTDVGKTAFSVALLSAARARGWRTAAMKPIATGALSTELGLRNDDAMLLQQASTSDLAINCYAEVNPYCFVPAIAPHIAAREAGIVPSLTHITASYQRLTRDCEFALVEGAGGWLSPLSDKIDHADLAKSLALPVILIVQMRLGCIHQARASLRAIQSDGVRCLGYVTNAWPEPMPYLVENLAALAHYLDVPCLGQSIGEAADQIVHSIKL
jgi:dethiobiotin synthetase